MRGFEFVSRKITRHAARIKLGLDNELRLGNLEAQRDWGHARDYVKAMWLMLQRDEPDDYVIASGQTHSVREFAEKAFSHLGLDYEKYVVVDERLFRPAEADVLLGDCDKAQSNLGWRRKVDFETLVGEMVDADMMKEERNVK